MQILTGAELLPKLWEANARATAFPMPEELPASRQELTAVRVGMLHGHVYGRRQHAVGCTP